MGQEPMVQGKGVEVIEIIHLTYPGYDYALCSMDHERHVMAVVRPLPSDEAVTCMRCLSCVSLPHFKDWGMFPCIVREEARR